MKFTVNQKVFAKVRGYPPWPARILEVINENSSNTRYSVCFYGTKESAILQPKHIFSFIENRKKLGSKRKIKNFNESMDEIIEDLTPVEKKSLLEFESTQEITNPSQFVELRVSTSSEDLSRSEVLSDAAGEVGRNDSVERKSPVVSRYGRQVKPKPFIDEDKLNHSHSSKKIHVSVGDELVIVPNNPRYLDIHEIELELMEIDVSIRNALSLQSPEPLRAIEQLHKLCKLEFTPFMLKKLPDIVQTIKKVRRYFGNPPMSSPKERSAFVRNAEKIRHLANEIHQKFEGMFPPPEGKSFYEYFEELRDEFHETAKGMSLQEFSDLMEE